MIQKKIACTLVCAGLGLSLPISVSAETSSAAKKMPASSAQLEKSPNSALSEERIKGACAEIERLAQKLVDDGTVPGLAISVVYKGKVLLAKGFGLREAGKPEKIDADTAFQLASVSKAVASTVVASLVGDKKISWDSRISDLDPAFEMYDAWVSRELTIRDMFAHRSGLPEHAGDLLEDVGYDREQVLHRLRYQKPDSSFRSKYNYTNFGLTEAAIAAAKSSGMSWEDASDARLYKPLGMNSTSSRFADFMSKENKAVNHVLVDGKWVHKFQRQPDAQSPAGGVTSSVNDLAKWMMLQMDGGKFAGKEIVSAEALAETHHPQMLTGFSPLTGLPGFYGLGLNVSYDQLGRLKLGHSGAFCLGAGTCVNMLLPDGLGICTLTNAYPIGVAEGVCNDFEDLALHGKKTRDWLAFFKKVFSNPAALGLGEGPDYSKPATAASPSLKNDAYTGKYSNEFFGEIDIVEKDNGLAFVVGPKKMTFALKHYNHDVFTYVGETENLDGKSGLRFSIGPDGKSASVLIDNLNVRGQGLFTRI